MSIDDVRTPSVPPALPVDVWRSVLHDVVDEVLDQILLSAEAEWDGEVGDDGWWAEEAGEEDAEEADEPPGDPPSPVPDLLPTLRDGLGAAIDRGVAVWGCDGTLRCTREFAERIVDSAEPLVEEYRQLGVHCDCAVLRTVLGRTGPGPRCAGDGAPSTDRGQPPA